MTYNIQALEALVRQWEGRWQQRRLVAGLPRVLLGALLAGCMGAFIGRAAGIFTVMEALVWGVIIVGMSVIALFVWGFRQRALVTSAREFDLLFGLQERVSTALEIGTGRINTSEGIATRQMDDALVVARRVAFKQAMPLESRLSEWVGVMVMIIIFGLILAMPANVVSLGTGISPEAQVALDDASATLRDITETIANSTLLTPEERADLLEMLEMSLQALRAETLTPGDAFAIMSNVEQQLRDEAERFDEGRRDNAALSDLVETLSAFTPESVEGATLAQLAESLENLSPEALAQLQQALSEASEASSELNETLSQALREASDALEQDDIRSAQETLNQADEALNDRQQEAMRQQEASEELNQMADEAQESAQGVSEAEQQQGEGGQPEDGQSIGTEGDEGETPGDEGVPAVQDSEQASDEQGSDVPSDEQSGTGESASDDPSEMGQASPTTGGAESTEDRDSDGTDEREFEIIYAPQNLAVEGVEDVLLTPDTSDMTTRDGDFSQGAMGGASVPYNQVFGDYEGTVTSALERGLIPLGLRDVVRDYFTRINPQRD